MCMFDFSPFGMIRRFFGSNLALCGFTLWLAMALAYTQPAKAQNEANPWAIRAFAGEKFLNFQLLDASDNTLVDFRPGNTHNFGIGYSQDQFVIDLAYSPNVDNNSPTTRFDLQSALLINGNYADISIQSYKGFAERSAPENIFRNDILAFNSGITYLKFTRKSAVDLKGLKTGEVAKTSSGSWYYGGFINHFRLNADTPLVEESQSRRSLRIKEMRITGLGMAGGYFHRLWIARKIFVLMALGPGIGLNMGNTTAERPSAVPLAPAVNFRAQGGAGYIHKHYYLIFQISSAANLNPIDESNALIIGQGQMKLAFGWKIFDRTKVNEIFDQILPQY